MDPLTAIAIPEPALDTDTMQEYERVVSELGIHAPACSRVRVERILSANGVRTFVEAQVRRYLDGVYGPRLFNPRPTWGWRALRHRDGEIMRRSQRGVWREPNGQLLTGHSYDRPVPLPVLYKVRDLSAALKPYTPAFFVSDAWRETDRRDTAPDPFLLLICGHYESTAVYRGVIERWDEPGFNLK